MTAAGMARTSLDRKLSGRLRIWAKLRFGLSLSDNEEQRCGRKVELKEGQSQECERGWEGSSTQKRRMSGYTGHPFVGGNRNFYRPKSS